MTAITGGGPAFPTVEHYDDGVVAGEHHGMSLRDWFIGQSAPLPMDLSADAVASLAGRPYRYEFSTLEHWQFWADAEAAWRVMQADAMIAARDK